MVPIYRSDGEWVAVYHNGYLYNCDGEWLGFVEGRKVFDSFGEYIGFLSDDRRLLRKRSMRGAPRRRRPPEPPRRPRIPAAMPLAPLMRSLPYQLVDVFEENQGRFLYVSETRPDME